MNGTRRRGVNVLWSVGLLALSTCISAHTLLRAPPNLLGKVGFDQELGAQVPLEALFRDASGASVRLGALLKDKPTLLVPAYYRCANLCSVVRAGVAHAVARSGLRPARDFQVVLVSFDPGESAQDAAAAQRIDAREQVDADAMSWKYLTGSQVAISALMRSIGFRYIFDPRNGQFDHDAGVVLLTPGGRVTQYLFGVQFPPESLRLGLVSASQGQIGNVIDHFLLLCCDYDVSTGRYGLTIHRVMLALGVTTALLLVGLVLFLRLGESRRHRQSPAAGAIGRTP